MIDFINCLPIFNVQHLNIKIFKLKHYILRYSIILTFFLQFQKESTCMAYQVIVLFRSLHFKKVKSQIRIDRVFQDCRIVRFYDSNHDFNNHAWPNSYFERLKGPNSHPSFVICLPLCLIHIKEIINKPPTIIEIINKPPTIIILPTPLLYFILVLRRKWALICCLLFWSSFSSTKLKVQAPKAEGQTYPHTRYHCWQSGDAMFCIYDISFYSFLCLVSF